MSNTRVIGVYYTCNDCGSTSVETKSWTEWNRKTQSWEFVDTGSFDYQDNWCNDCEQNVELSTTSIKKVKLNKCKDENK